MMRRLEVEALRADLSSVNNLLRERSKEQDPVGWLQFNQRKDELEERIAEVQSTEARAASVALFFGGSPVIGSRGILVDFGARAVERFQSLVSTRFAAVEGPLGERGPVPQRERSALMITEVAHGSFGFVLEGAERTAVQELPVTSLREVVDEVCDLINGVAGPDDADIDDPDGAMPDVVDKRVLADLQAFFRLLHDAGATLRIVGDRREFSLRRDTIARAKMRSEAMCVKESTERVRGRLYVLPEARRFELHVLEGGLSLRGSVSAEAMQAIVEDDGEIQAD